MRCFLIAGFVLAASLLMNASTAEAQRPERERAPAGVDQPTGDDWYYESNYTPKLDPKTIIHQKAAARAQQRANRIASLAWFGMNNSRPTASPTPLTGIYSPVWQMPGGQPYAWHGSQTRTIVIVR